MFQRFLVVVDAPFPPTLKYFLVMSSPIFFAGLAATYFAVQPCGLTPFPLAKVL
jgi:hypothetical protein